MHDIYLSLNNNILRLTYVGKEGLKTYSTPIPSEVVKDTNIIDLKVYEDEIRKGISTLTTLPLSKLNLNVVVEPEDVILRFITSNKTDGDKQEQLIKDMKAKVTEASLDDLYFSYQKIAPFLHQFIGVRKDYMEKLLELSNDLGISLRSAIPWLILLPKYVGINQPAVFICRVDGSHVIGLSELNGIFYSGVSDKRITEQQLEGFVSDLSLYKKKTPVKKVYTLNYQDFDVKNFEVAEIGMPQAFTDLPEEFKTNILVNYMVDLKPEIALGQTNLLTLMPLPVVEKKVSSLVYAGAAVGAFILLGALSFVFLFNKKAASDQNVALAPVQNENVLSEQTVSPPTPVQEQPKVELKKADLRIKILNGAGVNGLASRTKALLEEKGYKVVDIDTADEVRTSTLLRFNKDKLSYKDLIQPDLKEAFPDIVVEDTLPSTENYDVLLVAGSTAEL